MKEKEHGFRALEGGRLGGSEPSRNAGMRPARPRLIVVGGEGRSGDVARVLEGLEVKVVTLDRGLDALRDGVPADVAAVVLVAPLKGRTMTRAFETLADSPLVITVPTFAIVGDDYPDEDALRLYEDGACGVFRWPREALLIPRLMREILRKDPAEGPRRGDQAMKRALMARFSLFCKSLRGVRLSVRSGSVVLEGRVASMVRRRGLIEAARQTVGVVEVEACGLEVGPKYSDQTLQRKIAARLSEVGESMGTVVVTVKDGIGVITGTIEDREQLIRLAQAMRGVPGIKGLKNLAVVSGGQRRQDLETLARLKARLAKRFDGSSIDVVVCNRIAVLSGRARDSAQRTLIGRIAGRTAGIEKVINLIRAGGPS